jgi:hypothetical protein
MSCVYVLWPLKISNNGIWKWGRREHTQFYAKYNHTSYKERFSENVLSKKIWKIYPQNLNTTRSIEIVPRGGPPIFKLMLMNSIGRHQSSWWILEMDPLLGGCMLTNSRCGPLLRGCILINSRGGSLFEGLYVWWILEADPLNKTIIPPMGNSHENYYRW